MEVRIKKYPFFIVPCAGTKIQQFLEYKKLSYICIENIKIIIVYAHKNSRKTQFHQTHGNGY